MEAAIPGKLVITVRDAGGNSADWTTELRGAGGNPQHENSGEPAKLYLIIVADTHARGIGQTVKADLGNVEGLFRGYIPARLLRVTTLSDNEVNPRNVLRAIGRQGSQGLTAGRDTLVVYYSGHGDYNQRVGDHVMATSGGDLYIQRDVQAAASQLRPRVTVNFPISHSPCPYGTPGERCPSRLVYVGKRHGSRLECRWRRLLCHVSMHASQIAEQCSPHRVGLRPKHAHRKLQAIQASGIQMGKVVFMGGVPKTKIIEAFRHCIFFDDQDRPQGWKRSLQVP